MTADRVEAKTVHEQLLRLVQRSDARVLGEGNALLPRLVEIFVKVLAKGDKLVESPVAAEMAALLRQMQAALPADVFAGFVAALKPKQQQILQGLLAGNAQPPGGG
jgi:importin-5